MSAPPKSKVPDAYLLMAALAIVAFGATYVLTPGVFETTAPEGGGRARIVPGSFEPADGPVGAPLLWGEDRTGLASFLFDGLLTGDRYSAVVGLAALLLIIGGAFGMVMRTGTVERAIQATLLRGKRDNDLVPVSLFVAFSLGGAVFGMSEEAIVCSIIVIPALVRAGYDGFTGLICVYGATQVGFATSWMNPFSVVVAQGISDLPPLSGLEFRAAMWVVFTGVGALYAWRYARGVRLKPERSLAFASDTQVRAQASLAEPDRPAKLGLGDWLILATIALVVAWVAWGVATQGYYLAELSAQFFVMGVACAIIARVFRLDGVDGNDLVEAFRNGASQMVPAILVVAAAKGIVLLIGGDDPTAPSLLNTALHHAATATAALPEWATAWGMFLVQAATNLVVVSGSGQAALTMPLMAPLADLTGVTRQTAVLAFQLGDGFTNLMTPNSAVLMACLAIARIDFVTWLRFAWKPMLGLMALASATMILAHAIGYA